MRTKRVVSSFECFICHLAIISNKSNLRRHMKLHRTEIKCFNCLVCLKSYQNKSNFNKHWAEKHTTWMKKHRVTEPQFEESTRASRGFRAVWTIPLLDQPNPLASRTPLQSAPENASQCGISPRPSPMQIPSSKYLPQCVDPNQISIAIDFNQQDFGVMTDKDWEEIRFGLSK